VNTGELSGETRRLTTGPQKPMTRSTSVRGFKIENRVLTARNVSLVAGGEKRGKIMRKTILTAVLVVLCAGLALAADKKIIYPPGAKPGGNYSPGILVGDTLYVSGMGGEDASGKIPGTFEAEVKQTLDNIGAVLKQAGMAPSDVVSIQVYLIDGAMFQRMNAVYAQYFKDPRPTRTTVVVAKLVGPGNIEITATARK
jgi:2-iminobutanoate/2-iminopropanoate deaminase